MSRFWDYFARVGRWLFVLLVVAAWVTRHGGDMLHEWLGYGALMVACVRIAQGFVGPPQTRFRAIVSAPVATVAQVSELLAGKTNRYLGHTLLIVFLLLASLIAMVIVGITGALLTTDRLWSVAWIGTVHLFSAELLLVLLVIRATTDVATRSK